MPQSLCQIYVHLVFSTKNRHPFIPLQHADILHAYLQTVSKNLDAPTLRVGGVTDHVHLLARFPRTITIAKWVETLKSHSSKWIKNEMVSPEMSKFSWQSGYGAFSVSPSHVEKVVAYIQHQEAHHKTETFQEEYRRLLMKYEVQYDERYVWD